MATNGQTEPAAEPKTNKKAGGVKCKVNLLDGSEYEVTIAKSAPGQALFDECCDHISLAEKEYFSLSFRNRQKVRFWVNHERPLSSIGKKANWTFYFEMKFYPIEPQSLQEDCTRYLMFLQIRTDIVTGKLPCSAVTNALLGSYALQSDLGPYDELDHGQGCEYIKSRDLQFVPPKIQTDELLEHIAELHKQHNGMAPDEAESTYLDNAKNVALCGVDLHSAKEEPSMEDVKIGVCAIGLVIYKQHVRVNRFPWAKILKIAYKKNKFTIKLRLGEGDTPNLLVYRLTNREMTKRLWRYAVETHQFFRLKKAEPPGRAQFPHFGSKFRYSGRTQSEMMGPGDQNKKRPPIKINRKASTRFIGVKPNTFETGTLGFSTDRGEQHIVEGPAVATLDLKKMRGKTSGSTSSIPMASRDDNPNLSVIDPGGNYSQNEETHINISSSQATYSKGGPMYDRYGNPITPGQEGYNAEYGVDGYGGTAGRNRYDQSSMDRSRASDVMTNGSRYSEDEDTLRRTQEDQLRLRGAGGFGAAGQGAWGHVTTTTTKKSTRTYTDAEGNVVTEYITEKDGVIEKRVEKKKVVAEENDFDHDKALRDAILAVTDMDQDLSVEKIEIHTKSES